MSLTLLLRLHDRDHLPVLGRVRVRTAQTRLFLVRPSSIPGLGLMSCLSLSMNEQSTTTSSYVARVKMQNCWCKIHHRFYRVDKVAKANHSDTALLV